jgi:putative CocE/NonD family hydrolase
MQVKTKYPRAIRVIEHVWIPLSDGSRLAARIWLPQDAEQQPVPAILEYIPYRKNDGTATRDALMHPYFAGHGYAALRVDMRGSGDSDGILYDEYLPQEQDDALEVLAWIAAQPWCTGAVGIIGKSWGGFNGLQIAARRPSALKAVISVCSTDDRYADDVHYMGGCFLAADMLPWASTMLSYNALPPDPEVVGDRWRQMWRERLEQTPPFIEAWVMHQRRDAFWKHGSVCEDFGAITCPVYAVGGWADAYTNAIPRLLAGLPGPRKGLIGPWAHLYPHQGVPEPAIGFLQECLRWWDYWLKGIETGIMAEPQLRVWMQESVEPRPFHTQWPGRWVAEPSWPSPHIQPFFYTLRDETLAAGVEADAAGAGRRIECLGLQETGVDAGVWCPYGLSIDWPPDQRAEDGRSVTFTSAPLTERMEILGFPEVTLSVAANRPLALVAVRLCAISPTGASTLVTRGLLNLTHRESDEQPAPLEPGRRYTVTVRLNAIAHALPAGHRWRIAISPTYWPWAWPSPEPVTLSIFTGGASLLLLPFRASRAEDATLPDFGPAEGPPPLAVELLQPASPAIAVNRDVATGRVTQTVAEASGFRLVVSEREYRSARRDSYTIVEGQPLSAAIQCDRTVTVARGAWSVRVETRSTMSADATCFHLTNAIDAYEGEMRVATRVWARSIPRDLV